MPLPYDGAPHDLPDCGFSGGVLYYTNKPTIGEALPCLFYTGSNNITCPFLDAVMQAFTCFGEELAFLLLALTIFWCVSKEEGYYLLFVGFFGTVLNQFLKLLCRIPRPWVRDPSFTIVESARSGAGGYSFPSGHTQNAVSTFGAAAVMTKRRWVRRTCIALVVLVPFSRMYLGVHTPLDVGVAFLTALALAAALCIVAAACGTKNNEPDTPAKTDTPTAMELRKILLRTAPAPLVFS